MSFRTTMFSSVLALAAAPSALAFPHCVDFDHPSSPGAWGCCGLVFTYGAVDFTTEAYDWGGTWTSGGSVAVEDHDGDGDQELWFNNVNVSVDMPDLLPPVGPKRVRIIYEDHGGSVNLRVNGLHLAVSDFSTIAPDAFHSVGVHYVHTVLSSTIGMTRGRIVLRSIDGACIDDLAFGGQELLVDPVCGANPCTQPGDVNGDFQTNFDDLLLVLAAYGQQGFLDEDLDADDDVDFDDVLVVLSECGQ